MAEEIIIDLSIDLKKFSRDIGQGIKSAERLDEALWSVVDTAKRLEKALNGVNTDIDVTIDTSSLDRAESDIRALDGQGVDIPVTADTSQATANIKALDDQAPKVDIPITANDSDVVSALNDIKGELGTLKTLAVIDLVVNTAGAIGAIRGVVGSLPGANAIQETNEAVRTFATMTGAEMAGVGDIINNVFSKNLGESRLQIAEVAGALARLGVDAENLAPAIESVLATASVTGEDVNAVISAQTQLVRTGLVNSYAEAGDLIVTGFQTGGNRANDLLDTLIEYAPNFSALGTSGEQALSLINQALEAGTFNSDKLGDSFKELSLKLTEGVADPESIVGQALERAGLTAEAEAVVAGEMSGAAFLGALQSSLAMGEITPFDVVEIVGTPIEDLGLSIFEGLDFTDAVKIDAGTALESANVLTDTLGGALTELGRAVETELANSFTIAGRSLTDLLDDAKVRVQELASLIRDGTAIPDALEIVLEAPGLAERISEFEGAIGRFILDFLSAIGSAVSIVNPQAGAGISAYVAEQAQVQLAFDLKNADNAQDVIQLLETAERFGVSEENAFSALSASLDELISADKLAQANELLSAVRELQGTPIATVQTTTYAFPSPIPRQDTLQIPVSPQLLIEKGVDPTDVEAVTAYVESVANEAIEANRGTGFRVLLGEVTVDEIDLQTATLTETFNTAMADAFTEGMQLAQAGNFIDAQAIADGLPRQELKDAIQAEMGATLTEAFLGLGDLVGVDFSPIVTSAQSELPKVSAEIDAVSASMLETQNATSALNGEQNIANITNFSALAVEEALKVQTAWMYANEVMGNTGTSLGTSASYTPPPVGTPIPQFAEGGLASGVFMAGEAGREIISTNSAVAVLNNATTETLLSAMASVIGGGFGGGGGNTTINVNNYFNTPTMASAVGAGDSIARKVRGF